jgi:hypothetical protein
LPAHTMQVLGDLFVDTQHRYKLANEGACEKHGRL